MPTFGSLFAGIGGIDLGLERAGWTGRWQVEYEPFCQRVLAKHWPDVTRYGDIHDVDWSTVEPVDLIAGGFPCQPVSVAGKRLGQDDDRWLWPQFARAVGALRPRYVLVENVPGLLVRGMGDVLGDLAALGYDAEWHVVPAAAVGAHHLRQRVWIVGTEQRRPVADSGGGWGPDDGLRPGWDESGSGCEAVAHPECVGPDGLADATGGDDRHGHDARGSEEAGRVGERGGHGRVRSMADAERPRLQRASGQGLAGAGWAPVQPPCGGSQVPHSDGRHAQGLVAERDDSQDRSLTPQRPPGLFGGTGPDRRWPTEPDVGRVAHGVPHRVDRLRALGNAVVPQVVEFIGRRILEAEVGA